MFEAPKQDVAYYTDEQLEQMVPEYMAFMDKQDEEGAVVYLKDTFNERPVDILRFAGMVAMLIDERKKDQTPEVAQDADDGKSNDKRASESKEPVAGPDDTVEPALPTGSDSGSDVGSDS